MNTTLLIRPAARGGKYLGPDAADANHRSAIVSLTDAASGEWLGGQFVSTSQADAGPSNLMAPVSRAAPFATDSATVGASFTLDISLPTRVQVTLFGPLSHPDQARLVRSEITLLPGVAIGSADFPEGLVFEIPGLCLSQVSATLSGATLSCTAQVTMMCGCAIRQGSLNPGWPWPDTDFNVELVTVMQSGALLCYPLAFDPNAPFPSAFSGSWPSQAASGDTVSAAWLAASQPKLGNEGFYPLAGLAAATAPEAAAALMERLGYQSAPRSADAPRHC